VSRKVVFVSFLKLTSRVARDWYISDLCERGADVEYWDVIDALREPHDEVDSISPPYLHTFRTLGAIEARVARPEYANAVFVMLITYTGGFTNIYALLSRHDRRMVFISRGAMPTSPAPAWRKVLSRWESPLWLARSAFVIAKAKLMRRVGAVKPFEIVFAAGRVAMEGELYARQVIPINAFDYDEHVRVSALPTRLVASEYAVFLDINLPYQSDLAICGLPAIASEEYFASLNAYFRMLESRSGMPVVIATHPKAAYGADRFEGRTTMHGVTAHLVRDSALVLTHTSTSLSYAVLNEKPLVFMYTEAMRLAYKDNVMRELANFATYLNAPLVNVNNLENARTLEMPTADVPRYQQYKYDFLTSPASERRPTSETFISAVTGS
jgi:hypothetical protein